MHYACVQDQTFNAALRWHMLKHDTKIAVLAKATGVSVDAIKKARSRPRGQMFGANAEAIASYYGKDIATFIRCEDVPDAHALAALADLLTREERQAMVAQMRWMIENREE